MSSWHRHQEPWSDRNVVVAILAKQKAHCLPRYLKCLEDQTWPKSRTLLYIRTNNNTDATRELLETWVAAQRRKAHYHSIHLDTTDVATKVEQWAPHDWSDVRRFKVLGAIRRASVEYAMRHDAHYFVVDCDNFIVPGTLQAMCESGYDAIAPLLSTSGYYSNFHFRANAYGYMDQTWCDGAMTELKLRGIIECDTIHCTYFLSHEVLKHAVYDDGTGRYEYAILADQLRKAKVAQYMDNRVDYGRLTFADDLKALEAEPWIGLFPLRAVAPLSEQTRAPPGLSVTYGGERTLRMDVTQQCCNLFLADGALVVPRNCNFNAHFGDPRPRVPKTLDIALDGALLASIGERPAEETRVTVAPAAAVRAVEGKREAPVAAATATAAPVPATYRIVSASYGAYGEKPVDVTSVLLERRALDPASGRWMLHDIPPKALGPDPCVGVPKQLCVAYAGPDNVEREQIVREYKCSWVNPPTAVDGQGATKSVERRREKKKRSPGPHGKKTRPRDRGTASEVQEGGGAKGGGGDDAKSARHGEATVDSKDRERERGTEKAAHPLNVHFQRVYVINLARATERRRRVTETCRAEGLEVEFVEAIDGHRTKLPFRPNPKHGIYWNAGAAALVETTRQLLERTLRDPSVQQIVVLEDDVYFAPDSKALLTKVLPTLLRRSLDWELFYLGHNYIGPAPVALDAHEHIRRLQPGGALGTHAYCIHRSVIPHLLARLTGAGDPLDVIYADEVFHRNKSYTIAPLIAHAPLTGPSYILNPDA